MRSFWFPDTFTDMEHDNEMTWSSIRLAVKGGNGCHMPYASEAEVAIEELTKSCM